MTSRTLLRTGAVSVVAGTALSLGSAPSMAASTLTPAAIAPAAVTADAAQAARRVPVRQGVYEGRLRTDTGRQLEEFTFRVTKDRKVKRFRAALDVICSYGGSLEVETVGFVFPTTAIKNSGHFERRWKPNADSDILLRGRLKNGRLLNGYLDYSVGVCVRSAHLRARRR